MNERPILVQKFGGSSLADLERLQRVADKIVATREEGYDLVVVVSAMGDTTDDLLGMAKECCDDPSRRELDMLLSVGERISMALMSIAIDDRGHEAVSLTGSQCGIITTHRHANARIMDVRPFRVQDELEAGRIVIVAGYQGASYRRDVTTLGRGGSDTTAVALAAALGAEACELYSDVDGVFSADPRVVVTAGQLQRLSYEEMQEMARSGARVINEEAVEYARREGIALYAKSTHDGSSRGTRIERIDLDRQAIARAESGCPAVAVSHIERGLWLRAGESAEALMAMVEGHRAPVLQWEPAEGVTIYLTVDDIHGEAAFIDGCRSLGADVEVEEAGLISAVGAGIGRGGRWAKMAQRRLAEAVDIKGLAMGADRLSWIVACPDVEEGSRHLHAVLIDEMGS